MSQLSYRNGQFVTDDQLTVSVTDLGFTLGVTVSEQLRTFKGKLFQTDEHLQRLQESLQIIGLETAFTDDLRNAAEKLAEHNHALLDCDDDLGLTVFVTPGDPSSATDRNLTVVMFTTPLPFHRWTDKHRNGEHLQLSSVRQIPDSCWPAALKCRSRMHYYLADQEARRENPNARAVLLDQDGFVAEASTASLILFRAADGLIAPRPEKVLPGVSVDYVRRTAEQLKIPYQHQDILPEELSSADELLLCSTSPCIVPVVSINNNPVGNGNPGRVFQQLISEWSRQVGVNIIEQAARFASR